MTLDTNYLEELYDFLSKEQFTSAIVSKMHKDDVKEILKLAFWKAEKDGKIADTTDFDHLLDAICDLKDSLGC